MEHGVIAEGEDTHLALIMSCYVMLFSSSEARRALVNCLLGMLARSELACGGGTLTALCVCHLFSEATS